MRGAQLCRTYRGARERDARKDGPFLQTQLRHLFRIPILQPTYTFRGRDMPAHRKRPHCRDGFRIRSHPCRYPEQTQIQRITMGTGEGVRRLSNLLSLRRRPQRFKRYRFQTLAQQYPRPGGALRPDDLQAP